jgi:organic radical activating enzyme
MLKERGLKAVIVTGGGEPTFYPQFNTLVNWLKEKNLKLGLITNGTNDICGKEKVNVWDDFNWIRVSLNFLNGKLREVKVPQIKGDLGFSMVFQKQDPEVFKQVRNVADNLKAKYVRILPDCTLSEADMKKEYDNIHEIVDKLNDNRFFVQDKIPAQAVLPECHQSHLRPFLQATGQVAPCDCFMLNKNENGEAFRELIDKFDVLSDPGNPLSYVDYLEGRYKPNFNPQHDCNGCAFVENNGILQSLVDLKHGKPDAKVEELFDIIGLKPDENVSHKEFI